MPTTRMTMSKPPLFLRSSLLQLASISLLLTVSFGKHADFIIVGGGTAGCALAGRLCEALPKATIVLLERGTRRNKNAEFSVRAPRLSVGADAIPSISEVWSSLPNPGQFGKVNQISTGRTLGGSSSTNGMQWTIPIEGTVESWNITGLSSKVALKHYRRAYEKVGFAQQPRSLRQIYSDDFVAAASKVGFSTDFDPFNQSIRQGIWPHPVAITKSGRRIDSCTAYVSPVENNKCRRNLQVVQGVTVSRLIISRKGGAKRVSGVEYVRSSDSRLMRKKIIMAKKEVIVSAGPYGSPKLLQLSGIGPAQHLRSIGIDSEVDLEVGARTQARAIGLVSSTYTGVPLEPSNNSTIFFSKETLNRWKKGQTSVLGANPAFAVGPVDDQCYIASASAGTGDGLDNPFLVNLCVSNPTSFGYLKIKDANPFSTPDVQLNLLGQPEDLLRLKNCINRALDIHKNLPKRFKSIDFLPPTPLDDDNVRENAVHGYHFVGGCAAGPVVNEDLKVHNVAGLRVVDSSVLNRMPSSAGPLASTYMLAEFMAAKISTQYEKEYGDLDDK